MGELDWDEEADINQVMRKGAGIPLTISSKVDTTGLAVGRREKA